MPGGGGIGRPLGPRGGRDPGGGGTGRPDGLRGGRVARWRSGATGAVVSGACAAGAWGAGAAAGADAGAGAGAGGGVGRLLISLGERGTGASDSGVADGAAAGASTGRGGAFLTGAALGAAELDADDTVFLAGAEAATGAEAAAAAGAVAADDAGAEDTARADLVTLAAFFAGAGSSGWTGRRNPSASAFRRTRSACASSIEDEWLLTPIPRERASSSPSLLVRPSSLASS